MEAAISPKMQIRIRFAEISSLLLPASVLSKTAKPEIISQIETHIDQKKVSHVTLLQSLCSLLSFRHAMPSPPTHASVKSPRISTRFFVFLKFHINKNIASAIRSTAVT